MQDADKIVQTLIAPGPFGVFLMFVTGAIALHKGYIRLGREVVALESQLTRETARADKWQEVAITQLRQTDRAIAVAKTATTIASGAQP